MYNYSIAKKGSKMVQDRKTGVWYNPQEKMAEMYAQQWFQDLMTRMANK